MGCIARPGQADRTLRWVKDALARRGVDPFHFHDLTWHIQLQVSPLLDDLKIFPWILQHLDQQGDLPHAVETEPAAPVPALKRRRKG